MNTNYELFVQRAKDMMAVACGKNKLTGSIIEMANIICGIGNMCIGGSGTDHNYHAVLDAAYELFKTRPDLEVQRVFEQGIRKAIAVFDVVDCKKIVIDLIIDQMEREKKQTAVFTMPCRELLESAKQSILHDAQLKSIFDQPDNAQWIGKRDDYIKKNFN